MTFLYLETKILQISYILRGNQMYDDQTNQIILMHVTGYIKDSKRFDEALFNLSYTIADFLQIC